MSTTSATRIKCAFVLIVLSFLGMGPIPVTSTIGLYVVIFRPQWFKRLVERIYSEK